jgi:hypothetical protein
VRALSFSASYQKPGGAGYVPATLPGAPHF